MKTQIIELILSVQSLPTSNELVQKAIKAEVLRLAKELDKIITKLEDKKEA